MAAPTEVLVTSESNGQLWNFCVWDVYSGTVLANYKGGSSWQHTLGCFAGEYFISAARNKPLIHVWAIQRKDQHHLRIVCPGIVTSLAVTPDGVYCIAGIAEKILIWQISTGNLLAVISRHYQTVTRLCITDDGSHFISGGDDNLVMVWSLSSVLQEGQTSQGIDPVHIWSNHSLPITDLYCTTGGMMARVVSASQDQTCKLWDICSGELLCNFVFDVPIYAVCMDPAGYRLFAGGLDGTIHQVNLFSLNSGREYHIRSSDTNEENEEDAIAKATFTGHSKSVTCLSVSLDGSMLISGSQDETVRIWHVHSKQCTRTISHKGPVTNAFIMPTPPNIQTSKGKPTLPIKTFKRHLHNQREGGHSSAQPTQNGGGEHRESVTVRLQGVEREHMILTGEDKESTLQSSLSMLEKELRSTADTDSSTLSAKELQQQLQQLQQMNKEMFTYTAKQIIDPR